ncbi:MAG: GGDEF domain-containing protein [Planctomycetota bacterium]
MYRNAIPASQQTTITKSIADEYRRRIRGNGCLLKIFPAEISQGPLELPSTRFVIGRGLNCEMVLGDESASREHACIELREEGFFIRDMRSTNGTFVNEVRITEEMLKDGDRIRIGSSILKFLAGDNLEAEYHESIYSMMITDALTGVHNKRFLMETLKRELVRAQRHDRPLTLVMFDFDHFKSINDRYGHVVGDIVLREIVGRIRPRIRGDEVFARYGGEEFVILLPETSLDDAIGFAGRLRALVAEAPISVNSIDIFVTISIGIAVCTGAIEMEPDDLIAAADHKLYDAKRAGRNRVSS